MTSPRHSIMRRGRPLRGVLCVAFLVLVACGSSRHLGAAEPAVAPPITAPPAGQVSGVGAAPEGIVYDALDKLVAVAVRGPDRLVLLDPVTLKTEATIALPGSVRHLQLGRGGRVVLVPIETTGQLLQIGLPDLVVLASTPVGKQPHDGACAGEEIAVGNEFGHSVSIIKGGAVVATLTGLRQPGGVIGDGSTVAVVDVGAFTLSTYDLDTFRRSAVAKAGKGPTHGVLAAGQRIVVADTRGNAILEFSLNPLKQTGALALPGTPYGMAIDAKTDTVWVTLTARNEVVGLDVNGSAPRVIARYPTVRQPNTVAVAPGSHQLWVTGTAAGAVQAINR